MRGGMNGAVPKRWTSLAETLHPEFTKTALIKAQIETLMRLFEQPLNYKIFFEDVVLIQAGLICDKEFDQIVAPSVSWGISSYISIYYRVSSFSDLTIILSRMN
ncbi:hypothetical protein LIER_06717 [Lithospermum erythrorhizon]|uniref:Uncharacterized protein n=1 Tax=Lithospermum erythrorhizon TaxID=34254 RepID=A0AAV3P5T9_LITER